MDPGPVVGRGFPDVGRRGRDTRIVEEQVACAVLVEHVIGQGADGLIVRDIRDVARNIRITLLELLDGRFQNRCFDIGDDHPCTFSQQSSDQRFSNSACPTGDDGDFSREILHVLVLSIHFHLGVVSGSSSMEERDPIQIRRHPL